MKILVVAERKDGEMRRASAEVAVKAKSFGDVEVVEVTGTDRYHPIAHASAVADRAKANGVDAVLVRGHQVFAQGEVTGSPGMGRWVRPAPAAASEPSRTSD